MGITPTGAIYKTLTYDGVSSRDYGVYITGEAVYNAPQRDVEMVDIPGRNGAFELDKGRFLNIEVTYHAGVFADSQEDFATAIQNFRNYLCSKNTYCPLTDEYNPGEYRQAIYKSGLEVSVAQRTSGEFDITFECQPQRFLFSGNDKISITSGDFITNPSLYPAKPLLEIEGYGEIMVNGGSIILNNEPIGETVVYEGGIAKTASAFNAQIDGSVANAGDKITVSKVVYNVDWRVSSGKINSYSATIDSGDGYAAATVINKQFIPDIWMNDLEFLYGTASTESFSCTFSIVTSAYGTLSAPMSLSLAYDGANLFTLTHTATRPAELSSQSPVKRYGEITLDSTKAALGNPLYLDLDIGEAYIEENDVIISVNNGVEMPPELPKLDAGENEITYANTITSLDITPRWWRI